MLWSRSAIGVATAAGMVLAMPAAADPDPQVGEVTARSVDPEGFIPIFVVSDDDPAFVPPHPPLDEIPPMPMPEPGAIVGPPGSPSVYMHDAEQDLTWELPLSPSSGLNGAQGGETSYGLDFDSDAIPSDAYPGEGFGSMSLVSKSSLDDYPWRVNVKLAMRFTDTGGNTRWYVCSGTMNDPEVVLTAAHCVYARSPNGVNIFDWAEEIYVYPGWDGAGNIAPPSNAQHQNFGYARGTSYIAGSDYVNNGNFDRDCGAIRVTRSVGSLTGWFGWAYGGSCPSRTYNNASYPAENCPISGLHNGQDMYYWSGTVDSCPGNQFHLNTTAGCYTTGWGGMSGSGMYYIDGDSRFVHAVSSNGNRADSTNYCKLWEQWVTDMQSFENGSRGSAFDLQALRFRLSQTTIQAGTSVGGTRQHYADNPTNGAKNANHVFRIYLSSNDNISSSDTLLSTQNYNWNFGALSGTNVNMAAFTLPVNTTPGTYWIGLEYDGATDGVAGNNDTDGWDAQQVTVTLGAPDVAAYISPPNGSVDRPLTQDLDWSAAARATSYDVYFGTDSTPDAGEYQGNTSSSFWSLPTLTGGTTYYWRIDSRGTGGVTTGPVWSFETTGGSWDNCSEARTAILGANRGSTNDNTATGPIPNCYSIGRGPDEWLKWTAPSCGTLHGNTCGSTFNTALDVVSGCSGFIASYACSTNGSLMFCDGGFAIIPRFDIQVTEGRTYYIRVGSESGASGSYILNLSFDSCEVDLTCDGNVNTNDFFQFLTYYQGQDSRADFSPGGGINTNDFFAFLAAYQAGC